MKCKVCDTEMFIDKVDELEDTEVFHYKCPIPQCKNYGYKEEAEQASFFNIFRMARAVKCQIERGNYGRRNSKREHTGSR